MLQVAYIRAHKEEVIERLAVKNFDAKEIIEELIVLDERRRNTQSDNDAILAESNKLSKEIGELFKSGNVEQANAKKTETALLKEKTKVLQQVLSETQESLERKLVQIPNIPNKSVPKGTSEQDNEVVSQEGEIPNLGENAKPHWELVAEKNIIDFELGVKITGAGFPVYRGKGARMQRALINYFLDKNIEAGYEEIMPPLLVNEASGFGTGQLPDKEGQMYHATEDNLYLIPTAEVPVTNIFRNVIVKKEDLPLKCTAYTPCFRREAGSYGKDVRGLNRLHQFDKVEIVQIQHPDDSYKALDVMVEHVAGILRELGLPFRILKLCGGDLGFTSALTFDFEVYSAAQEKWLEVSSVSNFESYQSNRLKLRFKDEDKKTTLCHSLNGSALALPRIMAALIENYQDAEGITIPEVLVPYCGFNKI
ncbi:serine--tRNA ligase [Flavobacteriales bacterium]|jgi:seryl-tRNA synthetase|nr:serine--tRNA ligase [Flavobacteriales bacterium]